ncbi:MAG: hypothetical protein AAFW87_08470, partial [Pseudomonadota bacterium]
MGFSTNLLKTISKGITVKPWLKPIEGEAPMFKNLEVFRMSHAMAKHAGARQTVIPLEIVFSRFVENP